MARLLGIDYGTKKIGVAISDESQIIAFPHATYPNNEKLWSTLSNLVQSYSIAAFVVGIPLHHKDNSFETDVLDFVEVLKEHFSLPVHFEDESLTSVESRSFLIKTGKRGKKLKQSLDTYAAQNILNSFLEKQLRNS